MLRYPGGKQRAIKILAEYIPPSERHMCSPFLGGGSFELYCASALGMSVSGYDNFTPLTEFWQELLSRKNQLADKAESFLPILGRDDFYELQRKQSHLRGKLNRAAAFYVINRASFSGCTLSGGMSPGHPRFTPSAVTRLRQFPSSQIKANFSVEKKDFADSIRMHPDWLIYADPPYYLKNQNLYGDRGKQHRNFDHEGLRDLLMSRRGRWLLSYNNCDFIRSLYRGQVMISPRWRYGMSADKNSRELLVLSDELSAVLSETRGSAIAG